MRPEQLDFVELSTRRVRPLRTRILRPSMEVDADELARFEGDEAETTRHYGLCDETRRPVAVVTYIRRDAPEELQGPAVRLRGMAVAEKHRRSGLGRRLLQSSLTRLAVDQPDLRVVWCNARIEAAGFYEREGFERRGEVFTVEGIGPHVLMWRKMPRTLAS